MKSKGIYKRRAPKIPKVNLSGYNNTDRIPSNIEQILLNALILFNLNTDKVAKYFDIKEDRVNEIYIKWYFQLDRVFKVKDGTEKVDDAIDTSLKLLKNHIDEVKKNQDASSSKLMSASLTRNINSCLDRLVAIKEQNSKTYDVVTNKLVDSIVKVKALEKLESGQIENSSDYDENTLTVADRMMKVYNGYEKKESAKPSKPIIMLDTKENKETEFNSVSETAKYFGIFPSYITKCINKKRIYRDRYMFRFKKIKE